MCSCCLPACLFVKVVHPRRRYSGISAPATTAAAVLGALGGLWNCLLCVHMPVVQAVATSRGRHLVLSHCASVGPTLLIYELLLVMFGACACGVCPTPVWGLGFRMHTLPYAFNRGNVGKPRLSRMVQDWVLACVWGGAGWFYDVLSK